MSSLERVEISIVVPVFNEEKSIPELYEKLSHVLKSITTNYEIIFVDDGSEDGTIERLKNIAKEDRKIKVIKFKRNFGQTAALAAGFNFAKGNIIVTIDGDLQNDPEDIPKLIEKIKEGFDVVSGWRFERKDPLSKKIPSKFSNWLASKIGGVKLHDFGCSLKAYRSDIVKRMKLYSDFHRYIPLLAAWNGAKITEVKVRHNPRKYGRSKYGFKRLFRGFLDLIVIKFLMDYSTRPMHFFGIIGIFCFIFGFVLGAYLIVEKILFNASIGDRPLLILSVLLIIVGIQLLMMGLLGELLIRIYFENSGKDIYSVEEIINEPKISS